MKKMQANGYIEDLSITDKAVGIAGFLAAFSFTRWFNSKDTLKERVRRLEQQHETLIERVSNLQARREEDSVKLQELDKYMHDSVHKLCNLINNATLEKNFISEMEKKVDKILNKLEK